jgi:hypothetical protein
MERMTLLDPVSCLLAMLTLRQSCNGKSAGAGWAVDGGQCVNAPSTARLRLRDGGQTSYFRFYPTLPDTMNSSKSELLQSISRSDKRSRRNDRR